MTFFKNTISLLAVFCVIPMAFGATARVAVNPNVASVRMGSVIRTNGGTTTDSSTSTTPNLMKDAECFDAYTECMRGSDACGSEFEECTTKTSFHGKMLACSSVLYQCESDGIVNLFGSGATINNLATGKADAAGEIDFTYPKAESKMGEFIINAAASNRYTDSATCVKKYKNCLQRDSVCGEEFEMCTDGTSFGKLAPNCDNILALCPLEGIANLFGEKATARPRGSAGSGTVKEWVSDGADLAAFNAVNTCHKTIESCFLNACAKNPYRCVEGVNLKTIATADIIGYGDNSESTGANSLNYTVKNGVISTIGATSSTYDDKNILTGVNKTTGTEVRKYFKAECLDTIGANKYCYMTYKEKTPSKKQLADVDEQEEVFAEAYEARKTYLNTKLQTLVENFDAKARKTCAETVKSCAMRACGDGSGAVCYNQVFGKGGTTSIALDNTTYKPYTKIKNACGAIVMTDPSCAYLAAVDSADNTYYVGDTDNQVFTSLFGSGTDTFADKYGIVATLNASLEASYNDNAIAQMKRQCENVATNCVKSMCGTDYVNCYRSRTDISGTVYNNDDTMNKLGGVLDYNVILGLCQNTVRNASACTEHLAITKSQISVNTTDNIWGKTSNDSVGEAWMGITVGDTTSIDKVQAKDPNDRKLCTCGGDSIIDVCFDEEGATNDKCNTPYMVDIETALTDQATSTLFKNLLVAIEKEAQGLYQSKLIKQQRMCEAANNGGVKGANDMAASTYMWVKLKGNNAKVPLEYSTQGLSADQFDFTNDIYGGFCRIRVDIKSSDPKVNRWLSYSGGSASQSNRTGKIDITYGTQLGNNEATRYFAVGDAFTCGSWITPDTLKNISLDFANDAVDGSTLRSQERTRGWLTAVSALGGAIGGFAGMDAIQNGDGQLGGLLSANRGSKQIEAANACLDDLNKAETAYKEYQVFYGTKGDAFDSATAAKYNNAVNLANSALRKADQAGLDVKGISFGSSKINSVNNTTSTYSYNQSDLLKWSNLINTLYVLQQNCDPATDRNDCPKLQNNYESMVSFLAIAPTSTTYDVEPLRNYANDAITAAKNNTAIQRTYKVTIDSLPGSVDDWPLGIIENKETTSSMNFVSDPNFVDNVSKLRKVCEGVDGNKDKAKRMWTNITVGAVGAGVLGATTYFATRDIQNAQNDKAKQDAIKEWMDNIGSKIKCYIGADEVGSYGDVVSTTLE